LGMRSRRVWISEVLGSPNAKGEVAPRG
jgi:hypothetical protein